MNYYSLRLIFLLSLFALPALALAAPELVTLTPDRHEVQLNAGESVIKNIILINDTLKPQSVSATVEDFTAGDKADVPVRLLGDEASIYSLRDHLLISPSDLNFRLLPGERRVVPILVRVPSAAAAGGYYAAVLFSFHNEAPPTEQISLSNRIGSLFFVRVNGAVKEAGQLKEFGWLHYQPELPGPLRFGVLYENSGEVYLNPYGYIEVRNRLTGSATTTPFSPWFVLPQAVRQQEIVWPLTLSAGFYQATLHLNRGYGDIVDTAHFNFIVGKKLLLILAIILVAVTLFVVGLKLKK